MHPSVLTSHTPVPAAPVSFAYVKDALVLFAGLRPLSESYCVVITAFVDAEADDVAKAVLDSMTRTGLDPRPGWLALTKACIRAG